jgi:hypothetical protein
MQQLQLAIGEAHRLTDAAQEKLRVCEVDRDSLREQLAGNAEELKQLRATVAEAGEAVALLEHRLQLSEQQKQSLGEAATSKAAETARLTEAQIHEVAALSSELMGSRDECVTLRSEMQQAAEAHARELASMTAQTKMLQGEMYSEQQAYAAEEQAWTAERQQLQMQSSAALHTAYCISRTGSGASSHSGSARASATKQVLISEPAARTYAAAWQHAPLPQHAPPAQQHQWRQQQHLQSPSEILDPELSKYKDENDRLRSELAQRLERLAAKTNEVEQARHRAHPDNQFTHPSLVYEQHQHQHQHQHQQRELHHQYHHQLQQQEAIHETAHAEQSQQLPSELQPLAQSSALLPQTGLGMPPSSRSPVPSKRGCFAGGRSGGGDDGDQASV